MNILQLGAGKWGKNHFRILKEELGHNVALQEIGFYHPDHSFNLSKSTFYDAVVITTSSINHWEIVKRCFTLQIPVFCEKPVCVTNQQFEELFQLANDPTINKFQFQSGHQLLFMPEIQKAFIENKTSEIYTNRTGAIPRTEGAILSLAVHDVAICHMLSRSSELYVLDAVGTNHDCQFTLHQPEKSFTAVCKVKSISKNRNRTLNAYNSKKELVLSIQPDNWNRVDVLTRSLKYFCFCVKNKIPIEINNLKFTANVMKTIWKIMEGINETR